ncbi:hypothetical protein [Pseudidiomarina donghaiensis]|uniref:DUF637 domain-containing protein n=1 Tax=Pseudidiomarina donghaiensis TaxID=519452 RepID=A0A432XM09_9GAMM|nr:hypothetical protein [Pseudidiomarina donghaiensis]RUO49727.1 hypothetical protein CWE24_04435 [Pseudidiomarina donghaiensis]
MIEHRYTVAAAAFYGVGEAFSGMDVSMGTSGYYGKVLMHGITGGVMNVLSGGKFGHGFAAAGVTQAFAPAIGKIDKGSRFSAGRVAAAAVVGGTASSLSGGKFANGAITGAFSRLFNDEGYHQTVKKRVLESGNRALALVKDKSEQLYVYAKNALGETADYIAEKLKSGLSVKFDAEITG